MFLFKSNQGTSVRFNTKKKFVSGICVSLWSEAVVELLWDLALGVQSCEICGICVMFVNIFCGFSLCF